MVNGSLVTVAACKRRLPVCLLVSPYTPDVYCPRTPKFHGTLTPCVAQPVTRRTPSHPPPLASSSMKNKAESSLWGDIGALRGIGTPTSNATPTTATSTASKGVLPRSWRPSLARALSASYPVSHLACLSMSASAQFTRCGTCTHMLSVP